MCVTFPSKDGTDDEDTLWNYRSYVNCRRVIILGLKRESSSPGNSEVWAKLINREDFISEISLLHFTFTLILIKLCLLVRSDSTAKLRGVKCLVRGQELAKALVLITVDRLLTILLRSVIVPFVAVEETGRRRWRRRSIKFFYSMSI